MGKYLDKTGLQYFYGKLKEKFADKTTIENKLDSLTGALTWKGKFDTLPAVTDYEAGNVIGVGNKEYVLTVTGSTKAWEELGDEGSYLLKSVAEETYAKKTSIPTVNDPKVSIKMNGTEKGSFTLNQASAGEVDLGTVLTEHQDISGKVDKTLNAKAFEAITIKTSNSDTDMSANVTAIKEYTDNLTALGVDVTKGFNVPIRTVVNVHNFYGCLTSEYIGEVGYYLSGSIFYAGGESHVKDIYISPSGYYGELVDIQNDNELYTTSKDLIGAINEVNNLAKSKGNGTITEVKMNGVSKGTSGVVDLGTVITAHQDISGKQDKLVSGMNIKTINGKSVLGGGDITISSNVMAVDTGDIINDATVEYATKSYVDGLVGDINSVLESIING